MKLSIRPVWPIVVKCFQEIRLGCASEARNRREMFTALLLFMGIILLVFEDVAPLRAIGGGYLASPAGIILSAGWLVAPGISRKGRMLALAAMILFGAYSALSIFETINWDYFSISEPALSKTFKVTVNLLTLTLVFFCGLQVLRRFPNWTKAALIFAMGILFIEGLLAAVSVKWIEDSSFFHSWVNGQMRPRGSRAEASSFSLAWLTVSGIGSLVSPRGKQTIAWVLIGAVGSLLFTTSRGTQSALVVALLLICLTALVKFISREMILYIWTWFVAALLVVLGLLLPLLVVLPLWQQSGLGNTSYTSDPTRATWALAVGISLLAAPLGGGFAMQPSILHNYLAAAQEQLYYAFLPRQWSEINSLILSKNDFALSPKSLTTTIEIYLGLLGAALLVTIYFFAIRGVFSERLTTSSFFVSLIVIWVLVIASVSAGSITSWDLALFLGAAASTNIRGVRRRLS